MGEEVAITYYNKGRITIPIKIARGVKLQEGDCIFMEIQKDSLILNKLSTSKLKEFIDNNLVNGDENE